MTLGELIRQQRERLALTQDQVAARAGISKPYLSNIETGKAKNPPTDGVLERLELGLGFGLNVLRRLAHLERTPADVREAKESAEAELKKLKAVLRGLMTGDRSETEQAELDSALGGLDLELTDDRSVSEALSAGRVVPLINKVAAGYPTNFTDLDYPPRVADEYVRCPDVSDPQAFAARVCGDSMEPKYHEGDIVIFTPNKPAGNGDDVFVRFAQTGDTTFKRLYLDDDGLLRLQPLNPAYPAQRYRGEAITGLWPAGFRIEKLQ
jgi:phage repressor protein C with HTH and peptisase S24 domain